MLKKLIGGAAALAAAMLSPAGIDWADEPACDA